MTEDQVATVLDRLSTVTLKAAVVLTDMDKRLAGVEARLKVLEKQEPFMDEEMYKGFGFGRPEPVIIPGS